MAKCIIKNKLGNKTHTFTLPCDDTVASAFCASMLDGEYVGYVETSKVGTDVATPYNEVSLMIKNLLGVKTYLNLAVKSTKSEDDIYTALTGKTYNGVKADNISILKIRSVL